MGIDYTGCEAMFQSFKYIDKTNKNVLTFNEAKQFMAHHNSKNG